MNEKYKAIYKCRLCGENFETEAHDFSGCEFPTSSIGKHHECKDGRYGLGTLIGTYEVTPEKETEPQDMCGYCKGEIPVFSSLRQFVGRIESIAGYINGKNMIVSTMITTIDEIIPPSIAKIEMEYCPKCGRRLT